MKNALEVFCMNEERILASESLQETLWRLEEVRRGFRSRSDEAVKEALDWVLSRQGLPKSYGNLFAPTEKDLKEGLQLLTGERFANRPTLTRHVLGEEALRAAIVWNLRSSPAVTEALKGFSGIIDRGGKTGSYCCYTCTMPFLRTLNAVKPREWDEILERGIAKISGARTPNGKWHGLPFYYTLLTLSEMDIASATDELRHASKFGEKLISRYQGDDRTSKFRKLALEATFT